MIEPIPDYLKNLIMAGESCTVEFKTSKNDIPDNLFETICAMLNRNGGHIFLGVEDNGNVTGVKIKNLKETRKNFANLCNNTQKINPTIHLELKDYMYEDKTILYIYVYESSDVHKTGQKVFDRNEDGDYDITGNTSLISQLYIRKSNTYIENKIFPFATIDDLRTDLIDKARQMAVNNNPNHRWRTMNNLELLKSASLYETDLQTGKQGINLAGILLFGKDETIHSAISYYKTDAILKIDNVNRYDDRDDIRTNLLESYDRLINFVGKHLNDVFYLEDDVRISLRDKIAREVCVNMLIHREYSNPIPARLIIDKEFLITENANKPRNIGYIDIYNYSPFPKNPKIAAIFKELGLADELGSGIINIYKYNRIYSGGIPSFKDDDIFKVVIPLIKKNKSILELKDMIFNYIQKHDFTTRKEINDFLFPYLDLEGKEFDNKIRYIISLLKKEGLIINVGSNKSPKWVEKR